jgi:hypothetical protein
MTRKIFQDLPRVRDEIAMAAARLIAEDGLDYATAKRKAARQIMGPARIGSDLLPDNEQIQDEIREYQALFQAESQPGLLRLLRTLALEWMNRLAEFAPYLTGAVLNGTAGNHSDIHLQLFCDNPKDVSIYLLNAGIQYDVSETRHFAGRGLVETLSFLVPDRRLKNPPGLHLALYDANDMRGAMRGAANGRPARAHAKAVSALLDTVDSGDGADSSAGGTAAPGSGERERPDVLSLEADDPVIRHVT